MRVMLKKEQSAALFHMCEKHPADHIGRSVSPLFPPQAGQECAFYRNECFRKMICKITFMSGKKTHETDVI